MKNYFIGLTLITILISCSNSSNKTENTSKRETASRVEINGIFTVKEFFDLNYQDKIVKNKLLTRRDSLIKNPYTENKIDTLSFFTFRKSAIKSYNGLITNLEIQDSELISNFFINFGATRKELISKFKDFEERNKDNIREGTIVTVEKDNITFSASIEQSQTWTFNFKNDSLRFINYEVYFD